MLNQGHAGRLARAANAVLLLDGRQLGPISSMQGLPPTSAQSSAAEGQKDAGHAAFFQVRGQTTL